MTTKTQPLYIEYRPTFWNPEIPDTVVVHWPDDVEFPYRITDAAVHFETKHAGMWHTLSKLRGIAVEKHERGVTVYGMRTLKNPQSLGYEMEGRVSIGGKMRRAFTSSQLFEIRGELVSVAILYI